MKMTLRCKSTYLKTDGTVVRCTRDEGHPVAQSNEGQTSEMHWNFTPGHKIKWPDSAAIGFGNHEQIPRTPEENETFNAVRTVDRYAHVLEDLVDWMLYSTGRDNSPLRHKAHALRRELEAWAAEGAPAKEEEGE